MANIHVSDVEAAINHWREKARTTTGSSLGEPLDALATVYAHMSLSRQVWVSAATLSTLAWQAWLDWYHSTPDTPCIAICSTSQGDDVCKGCGRTFAEVQRWTEMTPVEKRATWVRISQDGSAWRFNRYSERAAGTPWRHSTRAVTSDQSDIPPETSMTSPLT